MLIQRRLDRHACFHPDGRAWAQDRALQLYARVSNQARWRRLWSALTRRAHRLLDLASVESAYTIVDCRYAGKRTVPLSQIRGTSSDSRPNDFDADFCPLHAHVRARWLRLAMARLQGAVMPPVTLVEVEGTHYVTDGHHRISVARALGEREIEAEVTTWSRTGK